MIFLRLLVFLDVIINFVFDAPLTEVEPEVILTFDQNAGVDFEGIVQNDPEIHVNVVSYKAIHEDTVVVLHVLVWLVVLVQHPVREEVHAERDEAHAQFIEHF